eukprot:m51a1_g4050 hypothetical protein (250) ;mRNA; r:697050-697881
MAPLTSTALCAAALLLSCASAVTFTLEFDRVDINSTLLVTNSSIVWVKTNWSDGALVTPAWYYKPPLRTGWRAKKIVVTVGANTDLRSVNKLLFIPVSNPTFAANMSDENQKIPSYIKVLKAADAVEGKEITLDGGVAFVQYKCCFEIMQDRQTLEYSIQQSPSYLNLTFRAEGERLEASVMMLLGLIVVFFGPGILIGLCWVVKHPRGKDAHNPKKRATFRKMQMAVFWVSFLAAFVALIVGFLLPTW